MQPLTETSSRRLGAALSKAIVVLGLSLSSTVVLAAERLTNVVVRSTPAAPASAAPPAAHPGGPLALPSRVSFNSPALLSLRTAAPGLAADRRDRIDPTVPRLLELHRLAAMGRQPLMRRWHPGSTPFDQLTAPRTATTPLLSIHVADFERWGAVMEAAMTGGACPCLAAAHPGRVPDGAEVPGTPLLVARNRNAPSYLDLLWSASCSSSAIDYAIYQGQIGSWTSHAPLTCSTGGALSATVAPGSGDRYFLVVPLETTTEGSYGVDSAGTARPPSSSPCRSGSVADSCP